MSSGEVLIVEAWGHQPIPHDFNMEWSRDRKKMIPSPNPTLRAWKDLVRQSAIQAIGGVEPYCGNVAIRFEFFAKTPRDKSVGDWWSQRVRWEPRARKASKIDSTQPDGDNLMKAALDSLKGVIIADDVTAVDLQVSKRYGPVAGARITITYL